MQEAVGRGGLAHGQMVANSNLSQNQIRLCYQNVTLGTENAVIEFNMSQNQIVIKSNNACILREPSDRLAASEASLTVVPAQRRTGARAGAGEAAVAAGAGEEAGAG